MGAYLYYKTTQKSQSDRVNDFLEANELNKILDTESIWLIDYKHLEWVKENNSDLLEWESEKLGKGDIKTSGIDSRSKLSEEDVLEMQTKVFEALNENFEMKYFADSCAFTKEENYFSIEQMKRITNNGEFLSGKSAKSDRARSKYKLLLPLLEEPEEIIFDISNIKENDEVIINKISYTVHKSFSGSLYVKYRLNGLSSVTLSEIAPLITEHRKFVHKMRYDGAVADIEACIIDEGTLIYHESVGTENMVKAITSVIMQGRVTMNDHTIDASFGYFTVNKAGNKRKVIPLDNGLAHAITYHSPSITDAGFSVLIGRDKDELIEQFSSWLENTNFLPYPHNLVKEIYNEMKDRELLNDLESYGILAVKIDELVLDDEALLLQELIIDVCRDNGLISSSAKPIRPQAPLPQSKYLSQNQVQKIFDTLNKMPRTYELEDVEIKPIGLKLFSPNMTLYITEADIGDENDEFENMHKQCYGYVYNDSDPQCSEWGYIDVASYLEVVYSNGGGFEMDLHFEDKYITSSGKILSKEELALAS
ncbi:MAG: hypothetical protein U9P72_08290 [Campylobacterota bacterium]|nr:hypothetical protein [Campylobacterota bacterium]